MDSSDFRLIAERKDAIRSPLATFGIALVITACAIGFPFPKAAANDTKPVIRALVSTSALRSQLMAMTPQGTSAQAVSAFVAREMRAHGETEQSIIDENARLRNGPGLIPKPNADMRGWRYAPVGVKRITAILRSPSLSFALVVPVATKNAVEVSYAFDAEDRLLDIGVAKWVESLP